MPIMLVETTTCPNSKAYQAKTRAALPPTSIPQRKSLCGGEVSWIRWTRPHCQIEAATPAMSGIKLSRSAPHPLTKLAIHRERQTSSQDLWLIESGSRVSTTERQHSLAPSKASALKWGFKKSRTRLMEATSRLQDNVKGRQWILRLILQTIWLQRCWNFPGHPPEALIFRGGVWMFGFQSDNTLLLPPFQK